MNRCILQERQQNRSGRACDAERGRELDATPFRDQARTLCGSRFPRRLNLRDSIPKLNWRLPSSVFWTAEEKPPCSLPHLTADHLASSHHNHHRDSAQLFCREKPQSTELAFAMCASWYRRGLSHAFGTSETPQVSCRACTMSMYLDSSNTCI